MRIAVYGAGGVGGYFGARLAAAGNDVVFIARGAHGAAMAAQGLQVKSQLGDLTLEKVTVSDRPMDLAPIDLVMLCVKLYDLDDAAAALRPALSKDALVIPFQNGVDSEERLSAVLGADRVAAGIAYISATVAEPGVIAHHNSSCTLVVGPQDEAQAAGQAERLQAFVAAGKAADFSAVYREDMTRALWEKFVLLAPFATVTALSRQPAGVIREDADMLALFAAAVQEAVDVGRAAAVDLDDEIAERCVSGMKALPPHMKASMCHDLEAGRRLELEGLTGAVMRLGERHGVDTPVHRTAYAALKPYRDGS